MPLFRCGSQFTLFSSLFQSPVFHAQGNQEDCSTWLLILRPKLKEVGFYVCRLFCIASKRNHSKHARQHFRVQQSDCFETMQHLKCFKRGTEFQSTAPESLGKKDLLQQRRSMVFIKLWLKTGILDAYCLSALSNAGFSLFRICCVTRTEINKTRFQGAARPVFWHITNPYLWL